MSEFTENLKLSPDVASMSSPTYSKTQVRPRWLDFEANDYNLYNRKSISYESIKPKTMLNVQHSKYAPQSPNFDIGIIKSPQNVYSSCLSDMPQWKKDLIRRLKSNEARTMAARDAITTDKVSAIYKSTDVSFSPISLISNHIAIINDSIVLEDEGAIGGSVNIGNSNLYAGHDDVADNKICSTITTNQPKLQCQQLRNSQQNQQISSTRNQTNVTLEPLQTIITKKTNNLTTVAEQQNKTPQKSNAKMETPALNTNNELTISTKAIHFKSPKSQNIREKAEKLICSSSGGHYTPMPTLPNEKVTQNFSDVAAVEHKKITETITKEKNYNIDKKNNINIFSSPMVLKNQRLYLAISPSSTLSSYSFSSFSNTNSVNSINENNHKSHTFIKPNALSVKESTITTLPETMASNNIQKIDIEKVEVEIAKRKPTSLSFGNYGTQVDIKNLDSTIKPSGAEQTTLARKKVTDIKPIQLHSKRDREQSSNNPVSLTLTSDLISPTSTNTKFSQQNENKHKHFNNDFKNDSYCAENIASTIDQHSVIKLTTKADISILSNTLQKPNSLKIYKATLEEEFTKIGTTKTITGTSTTSPSSVTGSSPTKPKLASAVAAASGVSINNNKKKMVAVQEMKKTTQNVSHNHHHQQMIGGNNVSCGVDEQEQQTQQINNNNNHISFDSGEDLSYGPGIVEKLRDRYLSWATRESMVEKQLRSLDTLRRATSLCTLLGRDLVLDHDKDDDGENDNINENERDKNVEQLSETQIIPVPAQRQNSNQKYNKLLNGILKTANTAVDSTKKSAKFENNGKNRNKGTKNDDHVEYMSRSHNESIVRGSRAMIRGNDSLKRARSVEALSSERAAWNFVPESTMLTTPYPTTGKTLPINNYNNSGVTIEDKIYNARDRLIMGTDIMPPKRLTSFINETERPPPDLVKLTLKKFEATANRRPRAARGNSNGEVASKVATFKSIINERKPQILPKPTSPIKRQMDLPNFKLVAKPAEDLFNNNSAAYKTTNHKASIGLSEHTPDLIPRQRHICNSPNTSDSPVTALTKKMERMRIKNQINDNFNERSGLSLVPTIAVDSPVTALTKRIEKMCLSTEIRIDKFSQAIVTTTDYSEIELPSHDIKRKDESNNVKESSDGLNNKKLFEGDDAGAIVCDRDSNSSNNADRIRDDEMNSVFGVVNKQNDKQTRNAVIATTVISAVAAAAVGNASTVETGIESSSNVFSGDEDSLGLTKRVTRRALENIAKAGTTLHFKFGNELLSENHSNYNNNYNNMRPLISSATSSVTTVRKNSSAFMSPLTCREVEKNRINELRKTDINNKNSFGVIGSSTSLPLNDSSPKTSKSEIDASGSVAGAIPLWGAMCKRRIAPPVAVAENTSMVFNFSNRKEVPDYIENDGVTFRHKRELPKPNESGFVMLGDLTVETSTDSDYDDFSTCPPSPCDVEFENANIVIDGKSSIRQKAKDASCRVQFNDTLTSTFEYPSESSMVIVDDSFSMPYGHHTDTNILNVYENLELDDPDSLAIQRHYHVAVDEIIPLPNYSPHINDADNTSMNISRVTTNTPTKNILENLSLGSAPLGSYTPVKASIDNLFELGVTRAPITNGHDYITSNSKGDNNVLGNVIVQNCEPDSLQFLNSTKNDTILAYSEGTRKTDLLY